MLSSHIVEVWSRGNRHNCVTVTYSLVVPETILSQGLLTDSELPTEQPNTNESPVKKNRHASRRGDLEEQRQMLSQTRGNGKMSRLTSVKLEQGVSRTEARAALVGLGLPTRLYIILT